MTTKLISLILLFITLNTPSFSQIIEVDSSWIYDLDTRYDYMEKTESIDSIRGIAGLYLGMFIEQAGVPFTYVRSDSKIVKFNNSSIHFEGTYPKDIVCVLNGDGEVEIIALHFRTGSTEPSYFKFKKYVENLRSKVELYTSKHTVDFVDYEFRGGGKYIRVRVSKKNQYDSFIHLGFIRSHGEINYDSK